MARTYKNGVTVHEQHFLMPMEMHHELNKITIDFNMFKHDNQYKNVERLNVSELIRILLQGFINQYNSSDDPNNMILEMVSEYKGA